jgi:hypothetical protein
VDRGGGGCTYFVELVRFEQFPCVYELVFEDLGDGVEGRHLAGVSRWVVELRSERKYYSGTDERSRVTSWSRSHSSLGPALALHCALAHVSVVVDA